MNANQVKNMVTRVPNIRKVVPLNSFKVSHTTHPLPNTLRNSLYRPSKVLTSGFTS